MQVPIRLSFEDLPMFLYKGDSIKCTCFLTESCFIHPLLKLYHYSMLSFALVCLAKVCEYFALRDVMKDPV